MGTAKTNLLMIDLTSGGITPIVERGLSVAADIETPWKDAVRLQEGELTTHEVATPRAGSAFALLELPAAIGPEPQQINGQSLTCEVPEKLRKEELMPRWRETFAILVATLSPVVLARAATELGAQGNVSFVYPESGCDRQIQHLILALRAELEEGCPGGRLFGESLAATLATHLVRKYSTPPQEFLARYRGGLPKRRLKCVIDYINAHLGEEISLRQLSELAQMSQFHFGHLFKQSTGLAPHQFILRQRISRAKELILDDRLSLAEISQMLGFASQAHFTTVFRKLVGVTPRAYRNT
jgi:AraC-like DNA-binding protein